jgi:hypothetical protein
MRGDREGGEGEGEGRRGGKEEEEKERRSGWAERKRGRVEGIDGSREWPWQPGCDGAEKRRAAGPT